MWTPSDIAKFGAEVVLASLFAWMLIKYLPHRDRLYLDEMKRHTRQMNRLVQAFVLSLDDDDKRKQRLSDEIFKEAQRDELNYDDDET